MSNPSFPWPAGVPFRLGTRGSALALAQVELTRAALTAAWPELTLEVEEFVTRGDRKLDISLIRSSEAGGKGLFTKELEEALLDGRIHAAVHSLKDLPGNLSEGMEVVAVLPRAATADVLLSKHQGGLAGLPQGAHVGTSSVRRARQLAWHRPDVVAQEWRGNVQTRLRKLAAAPEVAAIILAQAGLDRLGFERTGGVLEFEGALYFAHSLGGEFYPALGQGAIALECVASDGAARAILRAVNHAPTWAAVQAERELQRLLGGDCTLPVGARTTLDGEALRMEAILFPPAGGEPTVVSAEGHAAQPLAIAAEVYAQLAER